ncbi:MAG TPA: universal stress protein [Gemmatimonadaceae bacterium]|nr:universal stress protein [Gemmatimonadaceae bacterium]
MHRFTRFLVSAAESDHSAVAYAARLAAASGASVTITNSMEQLPAAVEQLPRGWDVPELVRTWNSDLVKRAAARARRSGVNADTVVLDGPPGDALVREVQRGGYDLLIVSAPRNGMVNSTLSTAARLVRECPSAVLLVRAARRRRSPRVLVGVDAHMLRERNTDAFTALLMESALWFAEQINGEVHVVHAWQSFGDGPMRWGGVPPAAIARYHSAAAKEALKELQKVIAPFRDRIAPSGVHVRMGDPRKVIAPFAKEKRIDLLVIGTVARSGIADRILGNTAEVLLTKLPCSMLVVRPQ